MGRIERISEAEATRDLADIVNRMRTEGASYEIVRGDEVVARLMPAAQTEAHSVATQFGTLAALLEAMRRVPPLAADDSAAFEADLADVRKELPMRNREWD